MSSTPGFDPAPQKIARGATEVDLSSVTLNGLAAERIVLDHTLAPPHITQRMQANFIEAANARIDSLLMDGAGVRYNLPAQDGLWQSALSAFEDRLPFAPGINYQRQVFARDAILHPSAIALTVTHMVHYSKEGEPERSLFPSVERIEQISLAPVLTRVDTIFSGAGGAKTWMFSETASAPLFSQRAFLSALNDLARFDGVSVNVRRGAELPLLLRKAVDFSMPAFGRVVVPECGLLFRVEVSLGNSYADIDLAWGDKMVCLSCALSKGYEPVFSYKPTVAAEVYES